MYVISYTPVINSIIINRGLYQSTMSIACVVHDIAHTRYAYPVLTGISSHEVLYFVRNYKVSSDTVSR